MALDNVQPVYREQSLSIRVAALIEDMIRNGELKIGERLPPERILCEKFHVSRTVIREASRFLMAKGLLYSQTGNGTFVRQVDSGDLANSLGLMLSLQDVPARIMDLIEVRRALEIQIARSAAERATASEIADLENILNDLEKASNSPEEYAKKDLEFHFSLAKASQNPLFEIILSPLIEALLEVIRMALKSDRAVKESIYFHRRIFDMVKAKDVKGAGREMANHLIQTQQAVYDAMEKMKQEEAAAKPDNS